MEHKFTVIWRPLEESEFRLDFITVPDRKYRTIMLAAAQKYVDEICYEPEEEAPTAEGIIYGVDGGPTGYDQIAILDGHVPDARLEN